ncbi:MAG TPA: YIP1 family protein [Bacteroidota bacterium]|nr:YIP1 family protein [Bacteroidota bacterium]
MNETPAPPTEPVKQMSFTDKLAGIFSSPGDVYENVRQTPPTSSNWFLPVVILVVIGLIMAYVLTTNPTLADQMKRIASEQMEKGLQKQIAAGKMTQEQANQARDQMESFGSKGPLIFSYVSAVVGPFLLVFIPGLVYWLLGKWVMKVSVPFMKVAEVVGLTLFIASLESIITLILQIGMNSVFASPSLAIFISNFSLDNTMHALASKINIFTIWTLIVTSIGLARLFMKDMPKVLVLVFALWILWTVITVFGGAALRG